MCDWEVYWENKNQLKIPTNLVVEEKKTKSKKKKDFKLLSKLFLDKCVNKINNYQFGT